MTARTAVAGDDTLSLALSTIAQAIAASLELKEVFSRVSEACRAILPWDGMAVSLLQPGHRVRIHAVTGDAGAAGLEDLEVDRQEYSPRTWPDGVGFLVLVGDTRRELDPSYFMDRDMIARGYRSLLRIPLQKEYTLLGSLVFVSREVDAFTEDHAQAASLVAELLVLALEHERMARAGRERRRRRLAVERLLPALAGSLDVRAVFERVSQVAQDVVAHDFLALGLFNPDRRSMRLYAKHGTLDDAQQLPDFELPPEALGTIEWDYLLARDSVVLPDNLVQVHLVNHDAGRPSMLTMRLDDDWIQAFTKLGIRAQLRVPVRLNGELVGDLTFTSARPDMYHEEDVEFAQRVSEHVALALSHQRLAEAAQRTSEARDRAAAQEARADQLARELEAVSPHRALGRSTRWRDVVAQAGKVARVETTILITGESGTGKEVIARLIHRASPRAGGPFVALNCAALPEQLLESELFGHEKGAFTGAAAARPGRLEQAAGGVLFLDEVGEMSAAVQAKFLRVLQEREFQRLGGTRTLKADVRVLAATNRDLKAAASQGTFREDLYYRLAVFEIPLPALRERADDIPLLAQSFLDEIGQSIGRPAAGISEDALHSLLGHPWPGNVRELRNALERAAILCEGGLVTSEHLPTTLGRGPAASPAPGAVLNAAPWEFPPGGVQLDTIERDLLEKALAQAGNNKSRAARLLGLSRGQLYSRLEKHGLAGRG